MKERPIDWDKEITNPEEEYKKSLWGALAKRSHELGEELILEKGVDPLCDEILDKIDFERIRTDPNDICANDQEDVWRLTGHYPIFIYGEGDNEDEGK